MSLQKYTSVIPTTTPTPHPPDPQDSLKKPNNYDSAKKKQIWA